MTPNFNDKDFVLSLTYCYSINKGDVVLVKIPNIGIVIKRVESIEKNKIKLHGDNHEYKSKIYDNFFNLNLVQGKVFFKF